MQDSTTGCHPLRPAVSDDSATTMTVLVDECAVHEIRNGFETTMRMPIGAAGFKRRIVDLAHLVHHDERIEIGRRHASKSAAHWKTFAFKTTRRGGDRAHRARTIRQRRTYSWKCQCVCGYCWHNKLLLGGGAIFRHYLSTLFCRVSGQKVADAPDCFCEICRPRQCHDAQVVWCGPVKTGSLHY